MWYGWGMERIAPILATIIAELRKKQVQRQQKANLKARGEKCKAPTSA